ncbi:MULTISPECIES: DUF317 domain-containing protein [unclassified Streptomyces]|uniref:DUF317 domain-containing protein n=1 Tax=unclassified Streptomyces TaxID=2593676 RepID=UPI001BEEB762|nr:MULTISPECIES: DUF317 domain-containing protein [unclassified Streptomyces]BCM71244.1 hypothetical protein EASAB2608_06578 [Streptomyces sp. EAS-AB2608]
MTTTLHQAQRPVWQAHFGEHTPPHLITAFTTALTDPTPVARTGTVHKPPTRHPDLVTVTRQEVSPAQVASALEDRVRALAARHTTPAAAPGVPRRPSAGPGRTL